MDLSTLLPAHGKKGILKCVCKKIYFNVNIKKKNGDVACAPEH